MKNINWKLRFKNRVTLTAICVQAIAIVYAFLGMCGVCPGIGENVIVDFAYMVIELLCLLGVVVAPPTPGIKDSPRAMGYVEPGQE